MPNECKQDRPCNVPVVVVGRLASRVEYWARALSPSVLQGAMRHAIERRSAVDAAVISVDDASGVDLCEDS